MLERRWDNDDIGRGIGSAEEHVEAVRLLLDAMEDDGWVAEEPDVHLLPHIEDYVKANGGIWSLGPARPEGVRYDVVLQWRRRGKVSMALLTQDVYGLLGSFAEVNTHVRGYIYEGTFIFQVTTGMLDGDGPFLGHGHTVSLRIAGPSVDLLLSYRKQPKP